LCLAFVERKKKTRINEELWRPCKGVEPQVAPNGISNLEEKDARRVYDPRTFNRGDILLEDQSCFDAWVEGSLRFLGEGVGVKIGV